jgi:hypothetical protein
MRYSLSNVDTLGLYCTDDFARHFYFGKGVGVDLSRVGLFEDFRRADLVRDNVEDFRNVVRRDANNPARMGCAGRDSGTYSETYFKRSNSVTNVTSFSCLFSVGGSTFFRSAGCDLSVDCCSRQYTVSCSAAFAISDIYRRPLNFIPTDLGGTPYPITAFWTEVIAESGQFF